LWLHGLQSLQCADSDRVSGIGGRQLSQLFRQRRRVRGELVGVGEGPGGALGIASLTIDLTQGEPGGRLAGCQRQRIDRQALGLFEPAQQQGRSG
jgi:hypothetical protein